MQHIGHKAKEEVGRCNWRWRKHAPEWKKSFLRLRRRRRKREITLGIWPSVPRLMFPLFPLFARKCHAPLPVLTSVPSKFLWCEQEDGNLIIKPILTVWNKLVTPWVLCFRQLKWYIIQGSSIPKRLLIWRLWIVDGILFFQVINLLEWYWQL